ADRPPAALRLLVSGCSTQSLGITLMRESTSQNGAAILYRVFAVSCVVHALAVSAFWAAMFVANLDLLPGKVWLALAWLWLVWPVALMLHPGRSLRRIAWRVFIAVGLLVPCTPVIY